MDTHGSRGSAEIAERSRSPATSRSAELERVANRWLLELRAALLPLNLTHAQCRLLITAAWLGSRQPGIRQPGIRQSDIAAAANTDPVMTSEVLRTLEARALLARAPHPTDGRAKAITVTEAGARLADRALVIVGEVEAEFFSVGMPEFGQLAKALKKGGRGALER